MLKLGSQSACSTNWNSAVAGSKPAQMKSDSTKVTSEVHSAIQRALRVATASSRRGSKTMSATPTSGRKVVRLRMGKLLVMAGRPSPDGLEEVPRHHDDGADQYGEGVVIEIAGLQPAGAYREIDRARRDAVGTDAVDHRAVALLPQAAAEHEGRAHEQPIVELVEIPFVEEEQIERAEPLGDERRQIGAEHVEVIGRGDAEDEDRVAPERGALLADEEIMGDAAGEDGAELQEDQRRQHDHRRFMNMMHDLVAGARRTVEGHDEE